MASPVVAAVVEGGLTTAGTSLAVTLPAGGSASDEYLIVFAKGASICTLNALTDWTELLDESTGSGLAIVRYTGAGVPSNPTFTQSANSRTQWMAYRITGADKTVTPQIGTAAGGTSATPNPPASATPPSSKDYLFIVFAAMVGEEADDDTWGNAPPTNYTPSPPRQKSGGTAGTNLGGLLLAAERQLTTGVAEDPGTFDVDVSAAWRAQTITVHPVVAVGHTHSQPDAIAGTDANTSRVGGIKADSLTGTDAQAKTSSKLQTDSVAATDVLARAWAAASAHADTIASADAVIAAAGKTVADGVSVTDAVDPQLTEGATPHTHEVNDAVAATDQADATAAFVRAPADTLTASDAHGKTLTHPVADGLAASDAVARAWAADLDLADSGNWTDAAQPQGIGANNWTHTVNDSIAAADQATTATVYARTVDDAATAADVISRAITLAHFDTVAAQDAVLREWTAGLTLTDATQIADAVTFPSVDWSYGAAGAWTYGPYAAWHYLGGSASTYTGGTAFTYGG